MKERHGFLYNTLAQQYKELGLPTHHIQADINFTIFNLYDLNQPLPFRLPVSRLNFFVFGFIKKAIGHYTIDDQQHQLLPNTIYFTGPGHYRSFEYTSLEDVYLITFSEGFLKENVRANVFEEFSFLLTETLPATIVEPAAFAEFEQLCVQIHNEYQSKSPFRRRLIGSLLIVLLFKFKEHFLFGRNALQQGNRNSEIVNSFKQLLEKQYRDLGRGMVDHVFRVQDYAGAQNIHPIYLSNVIKSETGKTVGTWITEKNIAEAKALLQHSSVTVKEIAYRLGFAEPAHFSNYFKKYTDVSPVVYRTQNKALVP